MSHISCNLFPVSVSQNCLISDNSSSVLISTSRTPFSLILLILGLLFFLMRRLFSVWLPHVKFRFLISHLLMFQFWTSMTHSIAIWFFPMTWKSEAINRPISSTSFHLPISLPSDHLSRKKCLTSVSHFSFSGSWRVDHASRMVFLLFRIIPGKTSSMRGLGMSGSMLPDDMALLVIISLPRRSLTFSILSLFCL